MLIKENLEGQKKEAVEYEKETLGILRSNRFYFLTRLVSLLLRYTR